MLPDNWPELLLPGLRRVWALQIRSRESLAKRSLIYNSSTSELAQERFLGVGSLDSSGWGQFERTGRTVYDEFRRSFETQIRHLEFSKGIQVRRTLLEDNLYPTAGIPRSVTQRVSSLATSAELLREKSAAELFVNAFTETGTDDNGFPVAGGDSVALCSERHPLAPDDLRKVQSNLVRLALTKDNIKSGRLLMRKFTDDRGEIIASAPDLLLVPPELEDDAFIATQTRQEPGSANNDVNPQAGRWNVISWDYLTDDRAWFMIDSLLRDEHLMWFDRHLPEFNGNMDPDTMIARFTGYLRFSRGFDDWRWILGSEGE